MKNKPYLLALNRIPNVGPRTVLKLLQHFPSLQDVFKCSQTSLESLGLNSQQSLAIQSFNMKSIEADLAFEKEEDQHLLTIEDEAYPALLKEIHDPPIVLYLAGNLAALKQPAIAIVGTRNPSAAGGDTAFLFAKGLAKVALTLVSGLAYGIDARAHEGCLAENGHTIAVMGTGMQTIYPRRHTDLAQKIKQNGLLITEFPLESSANAGHFPRRNRIISGLSLGVLVVEAAIKSGSLITARLSLDQNREVFAIPGSIHNEQAKGCNYLLQQGAKLVTSVQDILDELPIPFVDTCSGIKPVPTTLCKGQLSEKSALEDRPFLREQADLLNCINFEMTAIDSIILQSGFELKKVVCELAQLELDGLIRAVPGGYARCVAL